MGRFSGIEDMNFNDAFEALCRADGHCQGFMEDVLGKIDPEILNDFDEAILQYLSVAHQTINNIKSDLSSLSAQVEEINERLDEIAES